MGRRPAGDRPLTGAERQAKYLAAKLAAGAKATSGARCPAAEEFPYLKLIHLAMDPTRTSEWIVEKIGPEAALAFYQALGRAIDAARR